MSNRLPEKLHLLRTSSGLTQSEMASRLLVPVAEYMNWENGNSIPGIDQLKQIAALFHVDLAALLDNTMTFVAPAAISPQQTSAEASATIPFASDASATQTLGDTKRVGTSEEATKTLNTAALYDVKEDNDLGKDAHVSHHHQEEDDEEEEEEKPKRTRKTSKNTRRKKKKSTGWILAVCIAVAVIAIAAYFLLKGGIASSSNTVDNNSRLILTDTYSMYVTDDGELKALGTDYSTTESALQDAVQISSYGSLAAGLKKNGTAVTNSSSIDVSDWDDLTAVSAGADHVVGLKSDGTVVCEGNSSACDVGEWTDVSSIYAGNGITVALKNDGSFLSSGGVGIPDVTGVKAVAVTDDVLYYETSNGSVKTISLTSGASALSTSSLTGVKTLAASDQILAGLNSNGTVEIECSDDDISDAVGKWENVACIAVHGSTIIGYTKDGKMYGAGDNDYGQYEVTAESAAEKTSEPTASASASASATAVAQQLDMVSGVTFSTTTQTLQISWDAVANASYYSVSISPDIGKLAKATGTSVSVPASSLTSGTTYTVSITAHSNSSRYEASDAYNVTYTYEDKTIQLDTPENIQGTVDSGGSWTISWDPVENADSYTILLDGSELATINQTYYTISRDSLSGLAGTHTVSITAHSSDESYTDSEQGTASLTYAYEEETQDETETADEELTQ